MSDTDKKKHDPGSDTDSFPIRDFPDLRRLRKAYLKKGDKPIGVDSADNPTPDECEEDFGLTRSTTEEALEFLRQSQCGDEPDDALREFLDDE